MQSGIRPLRVQKGGARAQCPMHNGQSPAIQAVWPVIRPLQWTATNAWTLWAAVKPRGASQTRWTLPDPLLMIKEPGC